MALFSCGVVPPNTCWISGLRHAQAGISLTGGSISKPFVKGRNPGFYPRNGAKSRIYVRNIKAWEPRVSASPPATADASVAVRVTVHARRHEGKKLKPEAKTPGRFPKPGFLPNPALRWPLPVAGEMPECPRENVQKAGRFGTDWFGRKA